MESNGSRMASLNRRDEQSKKDAWKGGDIINIEGIRWKEEAKNRLSWRERSSSGLLWFFVVSVVDDDDDEAMFNSPAKRC